MPRSTWHSLPEYQTFRAMMESSTTAAAARRLGLSQSAVSRSLSSLEGRIGQPLFERDSGRLTPTAKAVELNARLDPLFDALDQIDGPSDTGREKLDLIVPPTFAGRFLARHVASFLKGHPGCFLRMEYARSERVVEAVREGHSDLGVLAVEESRAGTKLIPFRRAVPVCAMRPDHPLAASAQIDPQALHGQDLVALSLRSQRRAQLDRLFAELGVRPNIVAEVTSSLAAAEMVRAGLGLAVINPFPLARQEDDLVFRPFPSALPYQFYFIVAEGRPVSRSARHLMQQIRRHTPRDDFSQII